MILNYGVDGDTVRGELTDVLKLWSYFTGRSYIPTDLTEDWYIDKV